MVVFLLVLLANCFLLEDGWAVVLKNENLVGPAAVRPRTSVAQPRALRGIHWQCLELAPAEEPTPDTVGEMIAGNSWLSYQCEVVPKTAALTVDSVVPALPPAALDSRRGAIGLAKGYLRKQLLGPALSIKPRHMGGREALASAGSRFADRMGQVRG